MDREIPPITVEPVSTGALFLNAVERFDDHVVMRQKHPDKGEWISYDWVELGKLEPKMNRYRGQSQPIGTPAVMTRFHEDLYLSAMQIDDAGQFAGLRAFVNPMLYWIWIAAGIMLLGCVIAVWPSGRRRGSAGATEEAS